MTDIFVGFVSMTLGLLALLTAILNLEFGFQLPKAKMMEARFGRRGARIFYAGLGLVLVALGGAIMAGFAPNAG